MRNTVSGIWWVLVAASVADAERWRWPSDGQSVDRSRDSEPAQSGRIDSKVRFEEFAADRTLYSDVDAAGDYKAPAARNPTLIRAAAAESQGTLDDLLYCRCERKPAPNVRCDMGLSKGCSSHEHLCCYSPAKPSLYRADAYNQIEDVRPPDSGAILVGPQGPTGIIGPYDNVNTDSGESASAQRGFLYPERPSGFIGSGYNRPVLVGPGGPTGILGPRGQGVLVGPGGPTGIVGPRGQDVLVGPGGPTGILGPRGQGVLVGPGGPTGIVGPRGQGVLVGPGGPTGIIGPRRGVGPGINRGYGAGRPGILVGPGGPTGRVGPGRQVLVGPGGPTGQIGPRESFGK